MATSAEPAEREAAGARPLAGAQALVLGLPPVLSYADRFGYLPVTTAIAAQAGLSVAAIAWSVSGYLMAYGAGQPLWGALSDRFGRRIVLLAGLAGLAVADFAAPLMAGPAALIALRTIAGLMAGALIPTTLAAVGDLISEARRHQAVSRVTSAGSATGAAAMLVCGVLADRFGWRLPLFVLSGFAVVAIAVTAWVLPGARPPRPPSGRALRELWLARKVAVRLYAFAFGEGIVMLGAFPLIVPALRLLGQGAGATGATMGAYGLAAVAGTSVFGRLAAGGPNRPVLVGGLLLVAGLTIAAVLAARPLLLAAVASACLGAAFSLFHSRFQALATQVAPGARGLGIGLFAGLIFSGAALGTGAGTALAGHLGFPAVFAGLALIATGMLVAGYRLARRSLGSYGGTDPPPQAERRRRAIIGNAARPIGAAFPQLILRPARSSPARPSRSGCR